MWRLAAFAVEVSDLLQESGTLTVNSNRCTATICNPFCSASCTPPSAHLHRVHLILLVPNALRYGAVCLSLFLTRYAHTGVSLSLMVSLSVFIALISSRTLCLTLCLIRLVIYLNGSICPRIWWRVPSHVAFRQDFCRCASLISISYSASSLHHTVPLCPRSGSLCASLHLPVSLCGSAQWSSHSHAHFVFGDFCSLCYMLCELGWCVSRLRPDQASSTHMASCSSSVPRSAACFAAPRRLFR